MTLESNGEGLGDDDEKPHANTLHDIQARGRNDSKQDRRLLTEATTVPRSRQPPMSSFSMVFSGSSRERAVTRDALAVVCRDCPTVFNSFVGSPSFTPPSTAFPVLRSKQ